MIRRLRASVLFVVVSTTIGAPQLAAQCSTGVGNNATCSLPSTVSLAIPTLTELSVNSGSPFSLAPVGGTITAGNFVTGNYDVASTLTVTARANATWSATVRATNANFNAPCSAKPAGDLRWGRTSTTRSTAMSVTAAQVFSASNAATAGVTQQLFFNVALGWTTDPPGTCALPLTFSISSP